VIEELGQNLIGAVFEQVKHLTVLLCLPIRCENTPFVRVKAAYRVELRTVQVSQVGCMRAEPLDRKRVVFRGLSIDHLVEVSLVVHVAEESRKVLLLRLFKLSQDTIGLMPQHEAHYASYIGFSEAADRVA